MTTLGDFRGFSPAMIRVAVWQLFAIVSSILLLFLGVLSWNLHRINQERVAGSRALSIERSLQRLGEDLLGAESGQRAFLLTGDEDYLAPFESGAANARSGVAALHGVMTNAQERETLERLDSVVAAILDELSMTVTLGRSGQQSEALRIVNDGHGRMLIEEFRSLRADAVRIQMLRIEEHRTRISHDILLIWLLLVGGSVLGILLLYVYTRRTAYRFDIHAQTLL